MATKQEAVRELRRLGFEFRDAGRITGTWMACIDPIGRTAIANDCRGIAVHDHTCSASEFWSECIQAARDNAQWLEPCPHAPGECEFHDAD